MEARPNYADEELENQIRRDRSTLGKSRALPYHEQCSAVFFNALRHCKVNMATLHLMTWVQVQDALAAVKNARSLVTRK